MALFAIVSLAACSSKSSSTPSAIGNKDRAEKYDQHITNIVETSGEAVLKSDPNLGNVLSGMAVIRVCEFSGDEKPEMYVAYSDGTKPYANRQQIYGFDNGPYEFFKAPASDDEPGKIDFSEITSKSSANAKAPCIWIYTDNSGRAYLVVGEDLSKEAHYYTWVTKNSDGTEVYDFVEQFSAMLDGKERPGTYEKIELAGVTKEQAQEIFEKNEEALELIEDGKNG